MNQFIKKTLITSASVVMLLSAGAGLNNVQARRYRYRTYRWVNHKPVRRAQAFKKVRRSKRVRQHVVQHRQKANHSRLAARIPLYERQMVRGSLKAINQVRIGHGLKPLTENPLMNHVARMRAEQISRPGMFTHYDAKHGNEAYSYEDADKLGINAGSIGENIGNVGLDNGDQIYGDPKTYNNCNGYNMAHEDADAMINYDRADNNDHRKNILNPNFHAVGIAAYANRSNPTQYTLAEDFIMGIPTTNDETSNQPLFSGHGYYHFL